MISLQQTLFSMVKNESIPSKIRNKTRVSTLTLLFNIVLEVLATAVIEEKDKRNPDWKRSKALTVCR